MRVSHARCAKDRKGPQRTAKGIGNTTKDPQRTAKEHYGLSCRKLAPIELNGALYASAHQDFSHADGLSWEPALSDSQSVRTGRPHHLWTWKFHSPSQSSEASAVRRWPEGAVRAAAAARPARCVLVGMRRRCCMARSNQHLLMAAWRNWEVFVDQVLTAEKKQKLWLICAGASKRSFRKPP